MKNTPTLNCLPLTLTLALFMALGVVAELGLVEDARMAKAIARLLGGKSQILVMETQVDYNPS